MHIIHAHRNAYTRKRQRKTFARSFARLAIVKIQLVNTIAPSTASRTQSSEYVCSQKLFITLAGIQSGAFGVANMRLCKLAIERQLRPDQPRQTTHSNAYLLARTRKHETFKYLARSRTNAEQPNIGSSRAAQTYEFLVLAETDAHTHAHTHSYAFHRIECDRKRSPPFAALACSLALARTSVHASHADLWCARRSPSTHHTPSTTTTERATHTHSSHNVRASHTHTHAGLI